MKRLLLGILTLLSTCAAFSQGIPFIRNFTPNEYHAHNRNFDVAVGADGIVYVANFEGLLYYDKAEWHTIHTPGITRVTVVHRGSDNVMWTGGYNYFGRIQKKANGERYLERIGDADLFRGEVIEIAEKDDKVIFLVNNGFIYRVEGNKVVVEKQISTENLDIGLSDVVNIDKMIQNQAEVLSDITCEVSLDNGLTAAVKKGEGLIIKDQSGKLLYTINEDNGLCTNSVVWIDYDGHGQLWGATDNGIFSIAIPSAFSRFTVNEGLEDEVLSVVLFEGRKYVGTINGLFRLEGRRFVKIKPINYACWAMVKTSRGLLVATANGIYRISSNGTVSQLTATSSAALMDDDTYIYSGEMDGVYRIRVADNMREMICDLKRVMKIIKDDQGTIWLQSLYGEIWYKKSADDSFRPYQPEKGETDVEATLVKIGNKVQIVNAESIKPFPYPQYSFEDDSGVTWLTDNEGKSLYRWKDGNRMNDMDQFLYPFKDISVRAIFCQEDETWLGSDEGFTIINTSINDPMLKTTPRLFIRSFILGSDSILWQGAEEITEKFRLGSDERNLRFTYSLDYVSLAGKTVYRYQLNNGGWSAWTEQHEAEFLNLPHGSYTFKVQARDAFGHVSEIATVDFFINYPFYMRWFMILLYFILFLLLIYSLVRLRLRRLEKEKIRLEEMVQDRTAQVIRLEKMATVGKLTQGLIDRILNPLNYINNFSKLSEGLVKDIEANIEDEKDHMDEENYEDTMDVLNMLRGNLQKVGEHGQNTSRTLKAMEEMLKDRSGGIVDMNLAQVLQLDEEMVGKYFAKEIAEHHIKVSFDYPHSELPIKGNADQLSKTLMSLLSNAIYAVVKKAQRMDYSPEVTLTLVSKDRQYLITIRDNGIGIEKNIINKIFDPFFTTKTTGEASGVGLYLGREIIQNHGGDITVKSVKDEYSEFIITIPAKNK